MNFRFNDDEPYEYTLEDLEEKIELLLFEAMIIGRGPGFGLKYWSGTADAPLTVLGTWLFTAESGVFSTQKKQGKHRFVALEDDENVFSECSNETLARRFRFVPYLEIKAISPVIEDGAYMFRMEFHGKKSPWYYMAAQKNDEDVICRWVAALRYRTESYSDELRERREVAERTATVIQAHFRRKMAQRKAKRRRDRRAGLFNKAKGWWYGSYGDSDSDSDGGISDIEDDVPDAAVSGKQYSDRREEAASRVDGGFFTSIVSAMVSDMYAAMLSGASADGDVDVVLKEPIVRKTSRQVSASVLESITKPLRRDSTAVQDANELPLLGENELEDEAWENERWVPGEGWNAKNLLRTDRAPFSDRLGRTKWKSLEEIKVPKNYRVISDWSVDLSGQSRGACGENGWIYAIDFPPLDTELAKGKVNIKAGPTMVVRRRRWYRRRVHTMEKRPDSPVIWHGWLGKRSPVSGRWNSRYFILTKGVELHGKLTGVSLSYFRFSFVDYNRFVGSRNLDVWRELTSKDIKTWKMEAATVDDTLHTAKYQTHFGLKLAGEGKTIRVFSAASPQDRVRWVKMIEASIEDQFKRFTLTKSLELPKNTTYDNIKQFPNSIMNCLVPCAFDEFVDINYADDEFIENLHKKARISKMEIEPWSDGIAIGSRRVLKYVIPRSRNLPRSKVLQKFKIEKYDEGNGIHVMSSLQFLDMQYGEIFQTEVRTVATDWKGVKTRLFISMRVVLNSIDESVKNYIESAMRWYVVNFYVDTWMPFLRAVLVRKKASRPRSTMPIASPTGVTYEVGDATYTQNGKEKTKKDLVKKT